VFVEEVQISCLEFVRHPEMASSGDVLLCQLWSWCIWDIAFDNGTNSGGGFIREMIELVLLYFNDAHDVVSFDGDLVRSAVFNNDLAVLVVVNGDQGQDPSQGRCSWAVDRHNVGFVRMCFPNELCGNDAGGHCRNDLLDLLGRTYGIHFLVGKFNLPCVDIVDQSVAVHKVDDDDIVVELVDE
jgi:hypothetical protein